MLLQHCSILHQKENCVTGEVFLINSVMETDAWLQNKLKTVVQQSSTTVLANSKFPCTSPTVISWQSLENAKNLQLSRQYAKSCGVNAFLGLPTLLLDLMHNWLKPHVLTSAHDGIFKAKICQLLQQIYFRANTKQFILMSIAIAAEVGEKNYPCTQGSFWRSRGGWGACLGQFWALQKKKVHLISRPSPTEHIKQVLLLRDKSRWLKIIVLWAELTIKLLIGLSWRRS